MLECNICHIILSDEDVLKYNNVCPCCHTQNSFYEEYVMDIKRVSTDESFIQAMIKLKQEDPIEYQLKMQQLKNAKEREQQIEQSKKQEMESNILHCPTCNSTNVKRISGTAKVAGAAMFGLFSKTARSQFKCENCGYKW